MIIYIRFTTKDTSSKYITCTLVVSKLSVLKPYKYMSLSNILKPYIFYLSSDCETFFNIWKHKSIACVFKLLPLYSLKSLIQLRYQASNEPVHGENHNFGFLTGPTQTRLYRHSRWLEAGNFEFRN